jgi:hypothetical protein
MIFFVLLGAAQAQTEVPAAGCETVGAEPYCPPASVNDPAFGGMAEGAFRMRVDAARKALNAKEAAQLSLRKRVGSLIASGDCKGAYTLALTEGDLELAA